MFPERQKCKTERENYHQAHSTLQQTVSPPCPDPRSSPLCSVPRLLPSYSAGTGQGRGAGVRLSGCRRAPASPPGLTPTTENPPGSCSPVLPTHRFHFFWAGGNRTNKVAAVNRPPRNLTGTVLEASSRVGWPCSGGSARDTPLPAGCRCGDPPPAPPRPAQGRTYRRGGCASQSRAQCHAQPRRGAPPAPGVTARPGVPLPGKDMA